MKKWLAGILFIFSSVIICLAGCSEPIGQLYDRGGGKTARDSMWLIPRRIIYQIDERFMKYEDFQIFIVDNGEVLELFPDNPGIEVDIISNIGMSYETTYENIGNYHPFYALGRHKVVVRLLDSSGYDARESDYSLEVFSLHDGIGDGDGGIGIIWLE